MLSFSRTHGQEGVYPPYVQMLVDHAWQNNRSGNTSYSFASCQSAGGLERVTGGYLTRQLTYAKDKDGHLAKILASLVRSYGVKAQKSLTEVSKDVGLSEEACEVLLERPIDLRLVRPLQDQYEIAHDFLAQEISGTLVDAEEREFKGFQELLATKAAAFSTTNDSLTVGELLILFKHKERVLPSDPELKLLLASWVREEGPGLFRFLNALPTRLLELIGVEEAETESEEEARAMLVLLRQKISGAPLRAKDWLPFKKYKLGIQLAHLLSHYGEQTPDSVIRWAMRSKHSGVRSSVLEVVAKKVAAGHHKWIVELGRSASPFRRSIFEALSLRADLPVFQKLRSTSKSRTIQEFGLLQMVSRARNTAEVRAAVRALRKFRPRERSRLYGWALATFRTAGLQPILNKLTAMRAEKTEVLVSPISTGLSKSDFAAVIRAYMSFNKKEGEHLKVETDPWRATFERKATALSKTISRTANDRDLKELRKGLKRILLTPSSEHYALALTRIGKATDILSLIRKVEKAPTEILYWFHVGMAQAIARRMKELGASVPSSLLNTCKRKAFWESPFAERSKFRKRDLLPVRNVYNQRLYRRLVAHATIGATTFKDVELLKRMARHEYQMIARAAALRLTEVAGE